MLTVYSDEQGLFLKMFLYPSTKNVRFTAQPGKASMFISRVHVTECILCQRKYRYQNLDPLLQRALGMKMLCKFIHDALASVKG